MIEFKTNPVAALEPRSAGIERALAEARQDAELIDQVRNGDDAAFTGIVERHRGRLFALARSLTGDRCDAEDIVQETFIRAYRAAASFRGDSSLATWLRRIATNLARNLHRYKLAQRRGVTMSLEEPLAGEGSRSIQDVVPSGGLDPAAASEISEFEPLVAECTAKLPSRQRRILELRNQRRYSYEQIGAALRIDSGTVKSRIARARRALRGELSSEAPEYARDESPSAWLAHHRCGTGRAVAA